MIRNNLYCYIVYLKCYSRLHRISPSCLFVAVLNRTIPCFETNKRHNVIDIHRLTKLPISLNNTNKLINNLLKSS